MLYAKLINPTQLEYAKKSVTYNGRFIINPPPDILIDLGYTLVVKSDMPTEDNCYFTPFYAIENNQILQKWERHEIAEQPEQSTELSPEERLVNLENAMQDLILMTLGGK